MAADSCNALSTDMRKVGRDALNWPIAWMAGQFSYWSDFYDACVSYRLQSHGVRSSVTEFDHKLLQSTLPAVRRGRF